MAIRYRKDTVVIYEEIRDAELCGVTSYGKPKKCLSELNTTHDTIKGDLQPLRPSESLREFGSIVQGTYKLYLDLDVEINHKCKVRVNEGDRLFQVEGTPMKYTALKPHIKAILVEEGFSKDDRPGD